MSFNVLFAQQLLTWYLINSLRGYENLVWTFHIFFVLIFKQNYEK